MSYICKSCGHNTKKARYVAFDNINNLLLCNKCNMNLIIDKQLQLTNDIQLRIVGKRGDFNIIKTFKYDYWENRRKVMENLQKDNQSYLDHSINESY